ncbi:ubiquitin carboxyl-terminal hydrolase 17-like protein B [Arvicola amphibius]|uniref:ubiquitin carboxyl-terminal hydrolase 17-like protein B n=1 Tax=Arvicola amphibius TaxID=1047088 RepID=UPI001C084768|nr:ubiquitin carboxyl-terminal hydrolase 17-like protein B [Arvicola amphibius]
MGWHLKPFSEAPRPFPCLRSPRLRWPGAPAMDSHRSQQPRLCPGSTAVLLGDKFDLENLSEGTKGIVWRAKGEETFDKHPPPVSLLLPRAKCCLQSVKRKQLHLSSGIRDSYFGMSESNEDQMSHLDWLDEEVNFYLSENILLPDEGTPGGIESAELFLEDPALSSPDQPAQHQDEEAQVAAELVAKGNHNLRWKKPYDVGAGLKNTGNSCYLNAALQCLTHTPPLVDYMLSREHSQNCHEGSCVLCAMEHHVSRSLLHSRDVIQPSKTLTAAFHKDRQEDAHEFLMFILNAMHISCLQGSKDLGSTSEHSTLICEIFGGSWRSQIKCLRCQETTYILEPFLDITLDIKAAQSVEQALEDLIKEEKLCGENAYHCGHCQEKTAASKTLTVQDAPQVLLLVLNRFSEFTGDNKDREVSYPESLDFQPYVSQSSSSPLVYTLYAVLVHNGVTCHSGHYFCYVKAGNGRWYKMDDSSVDRCDVTLVLSEPAYLLFYVQQTALRRDGVDAPMDTVSRDLCPEPQVGTSGQRMTNRGSPIEIREPLDLTKKTDTNDFQWDMLSDYPSLW